jgi:hypothetical protein
MLAGREHHYSVERGDLNFNDRTAREQQFARPRGLLTVYAISQNVVTKAPASESGRYIRGRH